MKINCYNIRKNKETKQPELIKEKTVSCESSVISNPSEIYEFLKSALDVTTYYEEKLYAIALNTAGKVIGIFEVSTGSSRAALASPKAIFSRLIMVQAEAFILTHNHPSGLTKPSRNDIEFTNKLSKIGEMMEINLLDHIITGENSYFSFKNEGMM